MPISKKFSDTLLWRMRGWHAEGLSGWQIYERAIGAGAIVSYPTVIITMKALGLTPNGRHRDQFTFKERMAKILAMRRDGATMKQIADDIGVSRERIRQILGRYQAEHGGRRLTGWTPEVKARHLARKRVQRNECARPACANRVSQNRNVYCSPACYRAHVDERNEHSASIIIARRIAGETWRAISAETGLHASQMNEIAAREFKRRGDYTEAEIKAVWPRRSVVADRLIARLSPV